MLQKYSGNFDKVSDITDKFDSMTLIKFKSETKMLHGK